MYIRYEHLKTGIIGHFNMTNVIRVSDSKKTVTIQSVDGRTTTMEKEEYCITLVDRPEFLAMEKEPQPESEKIRFNPTSLKDILKAVDYALRNRTHDKECFRLTLDHSEELLIQLDIDSKTSPKIVQELVSGYLKKGYFMVNIDPLPF